VIGTLGFVLAAWVPVAKWVAAPLEERFSVPARLPERLNGIIVLGGSFVPVLSTGRNGLKLTPSAERLTTAAALALRFPSARIVVSGSGDLLNQESKEAPRSVKFLAEMGVDLERILLEQESRNTYENALLTHRLINPRAGEQWLLVTSAMHMPRAIGCFRRVGWTVIPYPVDFHTAAGVYSWRFDLSDGLSLLSLATREWIGLVAYRVLDRTSALFPRPA
jgi:uncharacterized SAM-binding protein YcdF (DUF218 family)